MSIHEPVLVADIGGSHARFALAQRAEGRLRLDSVEQLRVAEHASLADAAHHYLAAHGLRATPRAVLAVAAPVTGDAVTITNNPWRFSIAHLPAALGCAEVRVINDFAALALALPHLGEADRRELGTPLPAAALRSSRTWAVLGPGTGLGVAGLALRGDHAALLETEGGHIGFAPASGLEAELLQRLSAQFGRVSVERLVSGPGLVNLYRALGAIEDHPAPLGSAAEIAQAAQDGGSLETRALRVFVQLLGGFAGDIALAMGAWDGVYLAGGVAQKLEPWIAAGDFRARFEAKGRHAGLMEKIPTWLIIHPQPGLLGAAALALPGEAGQK